jgi:hypothetical protein
MFLLVRDEDAPTVAAAVRAFADEEGLVAVDLESQAAQNPLAMLSVLTGPRVFVTATETQVAAFGLESLDIAEADEWGTEISASCEAEVIVIDPAADGVRVFVYDGGELDEEIEVPLDPSGRTKAPALAELADDEEGRRALADGIRARDVSELVPALLRAFGVSGPGDDALVLAFVDPLDEEDEEGEAGDGEPRFVVDPLPAAELSGRDGGSVDSLNGSLFTVALEGGPPVEGLRLELSGDALSLFTVESIDVALRPKGSQQLEPRNVTVDPSKNPIVIELPDAYLERVDFRPPSIDPTDMFSTMQRLMSAGDARKLNTLVVDVRGTAKKKGEGTLTLSVSGTDAEASVPVHVR